MPDALPLTLDPHDQRVSAAEGAETGLYDVYGIAHTSRYIMLPQHGLRVRITETGAGDPVVIVPGNTGDGFPFIPLLPHLPGRRVIVVNRPGGGLSDGMDHETVDFHDFAVETLTTVFDALGLEQAPIIAHSMGGHWSQWFAIDRPERVTALALLGVPGNVLTTCPPRLLRLTNLPGLGRRIARLSVPKARATALNGLKITGHSAQSVARQPDALAECYFRFEQLPHYLTSTLSLMTSVNRLRGSRPRYRITAEQLASITQPVLYVWGSRDPFGRVETGREIASLVPESEFHTLNGAGHLPWLDDPEHAGRLVSEFLNRHEPRSAQPVLGPSMIWTTLGTMSGPIASPDRAQPANLLSNAGHAMLVDAGDGVAEQIAKTGRALRDVDTVILSHLHIDHTGGLSAIVGMRDQQDLPGILTIYGPPGTKQLVTGILASLETLTELTEAESPQAAKLAPNEIAVVEITDAQTFSVDGVDITAVANSHYPFDPETAEAQAHQSLSLRFDTPGRSIVYTGDTGPSDAVEQLAAGADLLISEITDPDTELAMLAAVRTDIPATATPALKKHFAEQHLTADAVGRLAARAGVGRLVLTHNPMPDELLPRARVAIIKHYDGPIAFANDLDHF